MTESLGRWQKEKLRPRGRLTGRIREGKVLGRRAGGTSQLNSKAKNIGEEGDMIFSVYNGAFLTYQFTTS